MFDLKQSTVEQLRKIDESTDPRVSVAKQCVKNIEMNDEISAVRLVNMLDLLTRYNPELNVQTLQHMVSGAAPKATAIHLQYTPTLGEILEQA